MKDPKIEKIEKIGNEECYVLTASSTVSKKVTLWISRDSYVIRKYERSLEPPEGGIVMPEMTDEQVEAALKSMGQEVTEENKKSVLETMENAKTMLKTMNMKGSSVEFHETVSSPELDKTDFRFVLPEGVVMKDSLFGGTSD